jgi:hypothetical protein
MVGEGAVPGITLSHPGLVLFPVDGSQLRASGGEVQVGAALLPLSALPDSCSEDEEGEEGELVHPVFETGRCRGRGAAAAQ